MLHYFCALAIKFDLILIKHFLCERHHCMRIGQFWLLMASYIDNIINSDIGHFAPCNSIFRKIYVNPIGSRRPLRPAARRPEAAEL